VGLSVRRYPGQRWLRIAFRTLHIAAAAMLLGAAHYASPADALGSDFVALLVGSGAAILLDDAYRYGGKWVRMAQFWVAVVKVALLAIGLLVPGALIVCLWAALLLGSVISHASGEVRHFRVWGPPLDNTSSRGANSA
jgi:hypothetical protein